MLENKIKRHEVEDMYLEDLLDLEEALEVWGDSNDLNKTSPGKPHSSDGLIRVDQDSEFGRRFS